MSELALRLPQQFDFGDQESYAIGPQSTAVRNELREVERSRNVASAPQSLASAELISIAEECSVPNWDGYGARPIDGATFARALTFLNSLPTWLPPPDIVPEADGELALDWEIDPSRIFSVSIGKAGPLHFAGLFGEGVKRHGTEPFENVVPPEILALIVKLVRSKPTSLRRIG